MLCDFISKRSLSGYHSKRSSKPISSTQQSEKIAENIQKKCMKISNTLFLLSRYCDGCVLRFSGMCVMSIMVGRHGTAMPAALRCRCAHVDGIRHISISSQSSERFVLGPNKREFEVWLSPRILHTAHQPVLSSFFSTAGRYAKKVLPRPSATASGHALSLSLRSLIFFIIRHFVDLRAKIEN